MGVPARSSTGALIAALLVGALALLVWLIVMSWLTTLNDSDAAGNGLTQGLSAVALVFLWVLLAVLMLVAALGGDMPGWIALAAVVLIPASGYAALVVLNSLSNARGPSFHWPIAEPAAVPPLIVALSLWAVMPPLRRAVPAWLAGVVVWGTVAVLGAAAIAAR